MEVTFERLGDERVSTAYSKGRALQPEEIVAVIVIANTYTAIY